MFVAEKKDSTIKLFGKTIQVGSNSSHDIAVDQRLESACFGVTVDDEDSLATKFTITNQEEEESCSNILLQQSKTQTSPSKSTLSNDKDDKSQHLWQQEDQTDQTSSTTTTTNNSQDNNLRKKPLKPIPCPRCSSMSTKFCYFNNYNVNQPRHFCKNCQRYWTNGGSMRNMPVGAGRRKSKKSSTYNHYHYQHHPPLVRHNSSESLGSRSIALTLKLMQKPQSFVPNGFNMLQLTRIENGCYNPNQYARNSGYSQPYPVLLGKHPRDETRV